jgi:hypothetical protein
MSSVALQSLRTWNVPPVHSGWRSLAPVFLLDTQIYWQNKKGLEVLYGAGNHLEAATEEAIDDLIVLLKGVIETIDGYLTVRGTGTVLLKKIAGQRHCVAMAIDAIKRGYLPGQLPPEDDRIALGNRRLREVQSR